MRFGRRAFVFMSLAYLVLLPIQFLIAGYGVMGGDIEQHMMFGSLVLHLVIPVLMLISALIGRGWELAGWAVALFVVLTLQIMMVGLGKDNNWIQGLHPFIAFLTWPFVYFVHLRKGQRAVAEAEAGATADRTTLPVA